MTKAPMPPENESKETKKNIYQTFDYTTIVYRLRTVSLGNYMYCHPTGVVKTVYGILTFPLTAKAV